jgi:uncharacterized protein YndB with AHSA1/START domain
MQLEGCMTPDRIVKNVLLRAPLKRVWSAISDSSDFGKWFGVKFDQPFAPGAHMRGVITPTTADPDVAKGQKPYEGLPFEIWVERMEPEKLLSFRWHPYAVEKDVDYLAEPTTLVEFTLEEVEGGILLTMSESGFDRIPLERRAKAFKMNEGGWRTQVRLFALYLCHAL